MWGWGDGYWSGQKKKTVDPDAKKRASWEKLKAQARGKK